MSTERNASRVAGVPSDGRVPDATVARLATYLRVLGSLDDRGTTTVSSEELAAAAGVNSAKLRKDLSFLGSYGIRGVGYHVETSNTSLIVSARCSSSRVFASSSAGTDAFSSSATGAVRWDNPTTRTLTGSPPW